MKKGNFLKQFTQNLFSKKNSNFKISSEHEKMVYAWILIMLGTFMLLLALVAYSVNNFLYWNNIEENLIPPTNLKLEYDTESMEKILDDYGNKMEKLEGIYHNSVPDKEIDQSVSNGEQESGDLEISFE